jgi:hypothetical protein
MHVVLVGIALFFFFPSGLKFWITIFFCGNFVVPLNNMKLNRICHDSVAIDMFQFRSVYVSVLVCFAKVRFASTDRFRHELFMTGMRQHGIMFIRFLCALCRLELVIITQSLVAKTQSWTIPKIMHVTTLLMVGAGRMMVHFYHGIVLSRPFFFIFLLVHIRHED